MVSNMHQSYPIPSSVCTWYKVQPKVIYRDEDKASVEVNLIPTYQSIQKLQGRLMQ